MPSKNSRVGKQIEQNKPTDYALGKYVPGNVGATWKTKCKKSHQLDFRRKQKIGNKHYNYIGT